jgi:Tfp pilus assembly protein PilF
MRTGPQTLTCKFHVLLNLGVQFLFLALGTCFANPQKSFPSVPGEHRETVQAALKAFQDNRLDDALRGLTVAEREQPSSAQIRNFRGIVLVRLGRNSEAAEEYREASR